MADEEGERAEEVIEEEEELAEPVDLSGVPDGPTTIFVGGFSSIKKVAEAVAAVRTKRDRIVVQPGTYDEGLVLDTTLHNGLAISGAKGGQGAEGGQQQQPSVVLTGALTLKQSAATAATAGGEGEEGGHHEEAAAAEAEEEEGGGVEGGGKKKKGKEPPPPLLLVQRLQFLGGAVFEGQTAQAKVAECVFGSAKFVAEGAPPRTVAAHVFSTVEVFNCTVYGNDKTALYCYPHSRTKFHGCHFIGVDTPKEVDPKADQAVTRRKRGQPPPPPPPPTAPAKCECEVGVYSDGGGCQLAECTIANCGIGAVFHDGGGCTALTGCRVERCATVGLLAEAASAPAVRSTVVKMCGRECLVVAAGAHPTVRGCTFVGSVRLAAGCVATGLFDNVVAGGGQLLVEDRTFAAKGFTAVEHDPTAPKKKKEAPKEE